MKPTKEKVLKKYREYIRGEITQDELIEWAYEQINSYSEKDVGEEVWDLICTLAILDIDL